MAAIKFYFSRRLIIKTMPPHDRNLKQSTTVRLSDELKSALKEAADANQRTMNAEITDRLERSLNDEGVTKETAQELLRSIKELNENLLKTINPKG